MAERAEQNITALPTKTSSGIAATDYLLGIDSAEGYRMLIQDLGDYIINNVQATLGGSAQTLAAAIGANAAYTYALDDRVTALPQNADLNDYTTPGCYVAKSTNTARTIVNSPFAVGFKLIVEDIVASGFASTYMYRRQRVIRFMNDEQYVRFFSTSNSGETWTITDWEHLPAQKDTYAVGYSGMGRIQQNDDLNSYTTTGSYVATSSGITATLLNCPFADSGFSLHVESVAGGTGQYIIQTIKRVSGGADIYTRTYTGSGWTEWKFSSSSPKQLSTITNLSDIPLGSNGYVQLDASVSPIGQTTSFTYWCTGTHDRRSIIAIYGISNEAKAYVNVMHNNDGVTWKGWKSITLS